MPTKKVNLSNGLSGKVLFSCALLMSGTMLAMSATGAHQVQPANAGSVLAFKTTQEKFIAAFLSSFSANNMLPKHTGAAAPKIDINFPVIRLFSDSGALLIEADDVADLSPLSAKLAASASGATGLSDKPGWKVYEAIIAKSVGGSAVARIKNAPGKRTLLYVTSDKKTCDECKVFEREFHKIESRYGKQLRPVMLTVISKQ